MTQGVRCDNKRCPKCKKSVILTDSEAALIHAIMAGEAAGLLTTDPKAKGVTVFIDTSTSR